MIKYFDCFAGIGAFRSAFEQVNRENKSEDFKCIGYCEIDKHAVKAYRTLYDLTGGELYFEDATKINTDELPDFDLLVGGFPCQSFSIAGNKRGFEDARGTLFFDLARILAAKKPRYFVLENVPNILSHDKGRTYNEILRTLSELGYYVEWGVLNSANFGIPQSRKRVFIVGCLGRNCAGKILPLERGGGKNPRQIIGGSQGSRVYDITGSAITQCSGAGGQGGKTGLYFIDMNEDGQFTDNARCLTARQNNGITNRKGMHSAVFEDELPQAVINPTKEKIRQRQRMKSPGEPMYTLTTCDRFGIYHKGRIRRLTPRECWRLQGFTDAQFDAVKAVGISDNQLYKQAGNSITVNVLVEIAKNLVAFDNEVRNESS